MLIDVGLSDTSQSVTFFFFSLSLSFLAIFLFFPRRNEYPKNKKSRFFVKIESIYKSDFLPKMFVFLSDIDIDISIVVTSQRTKYPNLDIYVMFSPTLSCVN